jgi:hypothetical protein
MNFVTEVSINSAISMIDRAFAPSCVCSEEFYFQINNCACKSWDTEMPDLSTQDGIHISSRCFRQAL